MGERYAKQTILPEIGREGQVALGKARVLCVGAGGLGCAVLPYLAGAGVGKITIIDDDRVDASNLQRQVLFGESNLGELKAIAAARRLANLNPDIRIEARPERLDSGNAKVLFETHDLVIDGSDNFATKYLAGDASVKFGVPLVYGSATGLEAMVSLFLPGSGPCLRCLFPEPPTGWVPNCAEAGVLGPLVGAAGCVQAIEAIKLLAGRPGSGLESLCGRLWVMDGRDLAVRRMAIRRSPDCPVCSGSPANIELQGPGPRVREIGPGEIDRLKQPVLVDVREPREFVEGHIPGAINRPLSALQSGQARLPDAGTCVVYCASGNRSRQAIELAGSNPGVDLRNLRGGIVAWEGAGNVRVVPDSAERAV